MRRQLLLLWELARKDLGLFLADRRGALLCFAVPIALASFFGTVFHRPGGVEEVRVPLLLAVEDDSPLTRHIVDALCANPRLLITRTDRAAALRRLRDQSGGVVLVLRAGFGRLSLSPSPGIPEPSVELLYHPSSEVESRIAEGVFAEVALREAATELLAPILGTQPGPTLQRPFHVARQAVHGPVALAANTYSHSFCGMTLQYLLFWGMDSGLLLLRERRRGIWRRLRAAPVSLTLLLGGRALATSLIALAQIVVTFTFGYFVFGVTVNGSWLGFAALALTAALLSAATGLLVAGLGGTEARARSGAILVILTLSLLGGLWLPSFLLPAWVQRAALALPTTWAARGLSGVTWQGMGTSAALRCAAVLLGFTAVFLAVAWWSLARAEAQRAGEGEKV